MIDLGLRLGQLLAHLGDRWPPAIWPVSCASTPMIWFGVSARISAPAVDEDAPAVGDKGVERAVVDDDDLDVLLCEAGGAQDRLRVVAQQLLDLGVADDRQRRGLLLCASAGVRRGATSASAARAMA